MKCGFVEYLTRGEKSGYYLIDWYNDPNNKFLRSDKTVKVGSARTFRFEGYKSSVVTFLLDYELRTFESESDHLYIKMGKEMETDILKTLIETSSKAVSGAVHAVSEVAEGILAAKDAVEIGSDYARKGMNKASMHSQEARPGEVYSWLDRQMNKRIILDLQAKAPGNDSSWKVFGKSITFATLASYVKTY